ncbi:hypothetical protein THAOC_01373 [Thalassiosira oceanica]|uniref:Uncharacterized protein n=1 Tax=Thalassiosira oceanica TaxID=159749 RepID=K0TII2_THAOC|nr:hypothetical protein THAOC_01373 [Thalassiosira oceanica]|eukprot:EJK76844.1 hypothetical protein THAOC_01373 [Thalassiosira oceanica]
MPWPALSCSKVPCNSVSPVVAKIIIMIIIIIVLIIIIIVLCEEKLLAEKILLDENPLHTQHVLLFNNGSG